MINEDANWDEVAKVICDELGESLLDEHVSEDDPYNWWLVDLTVFDLIEFLKGKYNLIPKK